MLDPNLTEDQAREKLARINQAKQRMVAQIMGASEAEQEVEQNADQQVRSEQDS